MTSPRLGCQQGQLVPAAIRARWAGVDNCTSSGGTLQIKNSLCWRQRAWPDTGKDCEVLIFSAGKSLGSANYLLNNKTHQTAFNILYEGKCISIIFNKARFKHLWRKRKGSIQKKGRFSTSNPSLCLLWILSHCKMRK